MEFRERLFLLAAVVVTMAIVTSADSNVVDLIQLFKASGKTRRQLTSCTIQYPTSNPCQSFGRTQDRFPIDAMPNAFIQCSSHNTMYLTFCPPTLPYFNRNLQDCSIYARRSIASGRTSRQLTTCSFQYPASNPCLSIGRTQNRFPYPSSPSLFIQCSSSGAMYLTVCPPTQPYFNENLLDCSATLSGSGSVDQAYHSQCGLTANPCTNLLGHIYSCPKNPTTGYLRCDTVHLGQYYIASCPSNEVFSEIAQRCEVQQPLLVSVGDLVVTGFAYPCTAQSIATQQYAHPYIGSSQYYIDCDVTGNGYIRSCPTGSYFNQDYSGCVSGIVGRK